MSCWDVSVLRTQRRTNTIRAGVQVFGYIAHLFIASLNCEVVDILEEIVVGRPLETARGRSGKSAHADVVKTRIRSNAEENAYLKVHYSES